MASSTIDCGSHILASFPTLSHHPPTKPNNPFTLFPLSGSSSFPLLGSDSLVSWVHHLPTTLPRKFRFARHSLASYDASHSSNDLAAQHRAPHKHLGSEDGDSFSGQRSVDSLDWLFSSPTYPSSADTQLSRNGGAYRARDSAMPVSRESSVSPRQIFRSIGTRSAASRPSIPGKFSKYSRPGSPRRDGEASPYRTKGRPSRAALLEMRKASSSKESDAEIARQASETQDESLASSVEPPQSPAPSEVLCGTRKKLLYPEPPPMPTTDLPFQFQFSYSEAPKVDALGYREPPFSPFGPRTMPRPWTGKAPLVKKKKTKELDSFNPPPPGKKGVKPVQPPGPYQEGEHPRPSRTREEILGEPLTREEIKKLVETCNKEKRLVNLGRDGLVHNMLDLIHNHWKRRRVIKFRCKGVPTVDMDNVCFHVEDKTGGKIIYRTLGTFYLFRGRNYNTKDRPHIPLMLWKPAAPVYPKLIVPNPGGLTKEEADAMRKRGRKVQPICRVAKNGVYINLVKDVRKAFEIDELVKVDCTGLNPSDYKKIGAKLKDLVPCVLLSFDKEQILMWRGNEWKSTEDGNIGATGHAIVNKELSDKLFPESSDVSPALLDGTEDRSGLLFLQAEQAEVSTKSLKDEGITDDHLETSEGFLGNIGAQPRGYQSKMSSSINKSSVPLLDKLKDGRQQILSLSNEKASKAINGEASDLDALWEQAVSSGGAILLDEGSLDPDTAFKKAAALKDINCAGDRFTLELESDHEGRNSEDVELKAKQDNPPKKISKGSLDQDGDFSSQITTQPFGSLPVDELAKLLAPQ